VLSKADETIEKQNGIMDKFTKKLKSRHPMLSSSDSIAWAGCEPIAPR
jgi:hypothetical protein